MNDSGLWLTVIGVLTFTSVYMLVRYGYGVLRALLDRQEQIYRNVLQRQLLIDISPRAAMALTGVLVAVAMVAGFAISGGPIVAIIFGGVSLFVPNMVLHHLATKRREKLDAQLVDGLTTLAAGVRAGLNLVQSIEMLVEHQRGPLHEEFSQLLCEYQMGLDLSQAMRNASDRIGSPLYRLTFTAMAIHRVRGGNTAESLDRIADSVREISRLEGKLDALTSQGRTQAVMMAVMPVFFMLLLYMMDPVAVGWLFTEPIGRLILLGVVVMIGVGFLWIRRIMAIDI
jgi:tight adherence protein B